MQSSPLPNAYFPLPSAGCLRLSGADRRAFLQRQTTNQINRLSPEHSLLTVLTSPTARILDVFILIEDGEAIRILTLPGHSAATFRYLRSRIFFNDKVALSDESAGCTQYEMFGPAAETAFAHLGLAFSTEANAVCAGADGLWALRHEPAFGLGFRLLAAESAAAPVEKALSAAGLERVSPEAYDALRIERGLPGVPELTEDYTPLETGLRAAVSDNKGCYTGQEIIARQITYDKVTRLLCGLRLSAPVEPGANLLSEDGAPSGKLTSIAHSPSLGWIALGIIKRPHNEPNTSLRIADSTATTVPLPFA